MSGNLTNHIELQSFDLYNRIEQIHRQPTAAPERDVRLFTTDDVVARTDFRLLS